MPILVQLALALLIFGTFIGLCMLMFSKDDIYYE